jgi:hypothetical protein
MLMERDEDISRMKAKIIAVFDTTGLATAYWGKYIGKIFKVVKIVANNDGESIYHLDMGDDGIKLWYGKELELIDDGVPVQPTYAVGQ